MWKDLTQTRNTPVAYVNLIDKRFGFFNQIPIQAVEGVTFCTDLTACMHGHVSKHFGRQLIIGLWAVIYQSYSIY